MSTINRLAASDIKKSSLYREHQISVQNALRAFGITSILEYPIFRAYEYYCPKDGVRDIEQVYEGKGGFIRCIRCNSRTEQLRYSLDNFVQELNLAIESDGKAHSPKGQRARDEKRDAYLESLGIHVLRFSNSTPAIAIAQAVALIKRAKEGKL